LSSDKDIRDVYEDEIMRKSLLVYQRRGLMPFISDGDVSVHRLWEGIINEEDLELLKAIEIAKQQLKEKKFLTREEVFSNEE